MNFTNADNQFKTFYSNSSSMIKDIEADKNKGIDFNTIKKKANDLVKKYRDKDN